MTTEALSKEKYKEANLEDYFMTRDNLSFPQWVALVGVLEKYN
jgi:hypothetical protein